MDLEEAEGNVLRLLTLVVEIDTVPNGGGDTKDGPAIIGIWTELASDSA